MATDEQKLDDVIREADEYFRFVKSKEVSGTRLDVLVVSVVAWFLGFVVLGLTSLFLSGCLSPSVFPSCFSTPIASRVLIGYLILAAGGSFAVAAGAGITTYLVRRRRRSKLTELRAVLDKVKGGKVTSEDGLRLVDAMHEASLVLKKRRIDSAVMYGIGAFILVAVFGGGLASVLVGVLAYLYFRQKALREFDGEQRRYEDSKTSLLQSL